MMNLHEKNKFDLVINKEPLQEINVKKKELILSPISEKKDIVDSSFNFPISSLKI